jgi:hypothetical protein
VWLCLLLLDCVCLCAKMPHKGIGKVQKQFGARKGTRRSKARVKMAAGVMRPAAADPTTAEYILSLCDPFEHSGVQLGWGTMVPTTIAQCYLRGTATANADGSLVLAVGPSSDFLIGLWTGGAGVTGPASGVAAFDNTAITANFTDARIVSSGIRSYPVIAATSVPGIVYAGALPAPLITDLLTGGTLTPNDFAAFPTSHMSLGVDGASSSGRPIDPTSFILTPGVIGNANYTAKEFQFSAPYNVYLGLPANAVVAYEVVMNIEGTMKVAHTAGSILRNDKSWSKKLSDIWTTAEKMWSTLSRILPPPGRAFEWAAGQDADTLALLMAGMDVAGGGGGISVKTLGRLGSSAVAKKLISTAFTGVGRTTGGAYAKTL